jgi:splicing factor 45
MTKYGWTKGTALGANESGILNPLRVQVEKRRKRADADGGGWAEPANKAKIIGGNSSSRHKKNDASKFGPMSEVIVLRHMLDNMPDLEAEIEDGLGQEIGGECGEKVNFFDKTRIFFSFRLRIVVLMDLRCVVWTSRETVH